MTNYSTDSCLDCHHYRREHNVGHYGDIGIVYEDCREAIATTKDKLEICSCKKFREPYKEDDFPKEIAQLNFNEIPDVLTALIEAVRELRRDVDVLRRSIKKLNDLVIHDYPSNSKAAKYPD